MGVRAGMRREVRTTTFVTPDLIRGPASFFADEPTDCTCGRSTVQSRSMEKVFILHHERPETDRMVEDVKLIGAYSTEEAALAAIARLVVQPGFRD